jgi:hypothetical protein
MDAIRNITGSHRSGSMRGIWLGGMHSRADNWEGALDMSPERTTESPSFALENYINTFGFNFDASRVVPIGPENSPRTVSVRIWRRIA